MSVAKLLLSGLLVSIGLILGAFTLHGLFASQWEVQATGPRETERQAQPVVLPERSRIPAAETPPDNWAAQLVWADDEPSTGYAEPAKARKRAVEKKLAEKKLAQKKEKAKPEEPQTVFPWLWNLIANSSAGSTSTDTNAK